MNEISCEVIQDLIEGCADGTASRATVKLVLEHIKMCDEWPREIRSPARRGRKRACESGSSCCTNRWKRRCAICDGASLRSPR